MHFEVLVEGRVEVTALSIMLPSILGPHGLPHTWKVHKHQGKGKLPDDLDVPPSRKDRSLLRNLPTRLRAFGETASQDTVVAVLVDLDDENCHLLKGRMLDALSHCNPPPRALFRIAIEELEAWFLGDRAAVMRAYPRAKDHILDGYQQDSICGTWERLADAVFPGGAGALKSGERQAPLEQKRLWARDICPLMDVEANASPSFCAFRDGLRRFAAASQSREGGQQ